MAAGQQTIQAVSAEQADAAIAETARQHQVVIDDLKSQLKDALGRAGMWESRCSSQFIEGYAKGQKAGQAKIADLELVMRETKLSTELSAKSITDAQHAAEQAIIGREARRDAEIKSARAEELFEQRAQEHVDAGGLVVRDDEGRLKGLIRADGGVVEARRNENGALIGFN